MNKTYNEVTIVLPNRTPVIIKVSDEGLSALIDAWDSSPTRPLAISLREVRPSTEASHKLMLARLIGPKDFPQ